MSVENRIRDDCVVETPTQILAFKDSKRELQTFKQISHKPQETIGVGFAAEFFEIMG